MEGVRRYESVGRDGSKNLDAFYFLFLIWGEEDFISCLGYF